ASGAMNIAPFAVPDLADFDARQLDDGTPSGRDAFMQSAEYTAAFDEVKALGGNGTTTPTQRTAKQTQIGTFWAYDGRPGLGTPPSNPRPGETNFTPPFPAYTSGHATFGAAAFQIVTRFYGTDKIHFTFMSDEFNGRTRDADGHVRPVVVRSFNSLTQAKIENAQSRIYLGIHWAFDRDEGVKQGDAVADYIFNHVLQKNSSA